MRLSCPNCGAQYEVPDEVIPNEGRDVQCSNCGDTWYQAHPDNPETATETEVASRDDAPADSAPADTQDGADSRDGSAEDPPKAARQSHAVEEVPPEPPKVEPALQSQEIDAGISGILREEAEREAQLRASEAGDPLESQPGLGLDDMSDDEPSQRAREARDRMAQMRGERVAASGPDDAGSRRDMLPDIEDITSTLRNADEGADPHTAVGMVREGSPKRKRNGFSRGFALIIMIGVIMALVYINAARIAQTVPQAEPMLASYVGLVDQARVWLDARLGEFIPGQE